MEKQTTNPGWHFSLDEIKAKLPDKDASTMRFHYALRHGTMKIGLYGPQEIDTQTPHKQDGLYTVVSGSGIFSKNTIRKSFKPHDAIFVEAGAEHRFEEFSEVFLTWVIFWGPDGGEG